MLLRSIRKLRNKYYHSCYYYEDFRYVLNRYISYSELISVMAGRFLKKFLDRSLVNAHGFESCYSEENFTTFLVSVKDLHM